jgi:hypothetical protein
VAGHAAPGVASSVGARRAHRHPGLRVTPRETMAEVRAGRCSSS